MTSFNNDTARLHLNGEQHELRNKYAFYLLAIAASAIAYALHRTEQVHLLYWPLIFILLATAAWALSFLFGCQALLTSEDSIEKNVLHLEHCDGVLDDHAHRERLAKIARNEAERLATKAKKYRKRQFMLILIGALFYFFWQVADMYYNSVPTIIIYR